MNNFFYDSSDYTLFKKALKKTGGEPVVINILSTDSSLVKKENGEEKKTERKNFSSRYEPSPFGKFFGPKKQRTAPVDTNAFASWKNKNYRKAEESLDNNPVSSVKFSLSDYMNEKFGKSKFNELDEAKTNLQKPINQLSSDDPQYKKFSLDSFMSKLEQQRKVEKELKENDDILEPLGGSEEKSIVPDSSQDEDFGYGNNTTIESVALGDNIAGDKFTFEKSELDKIKNRLIKIEEEQANIKKKSNEKIIEGNELSDLAESEFDLEKLGFAPIKEDDESENENSEKLEVSEEHEIASDEKTDKKLSVDESLDKLEESAKTEDVIAQKDDESHDLVKDAQSETEQENETGETETIEQNEDINASGEKHKLERDDVLTKSDLRTITDEFMDKFAEMYRKNDVNNDASEQSLYDNNVVSEQKPYLEQYPGYENTEQYRQAMQLQQQQAELQSKVLELIEANKQSDQRAEQKLRQIELEKQKVEEEYALKLKEIEESYNKKYEEYKKKTYIEKLNEEKRIKNLELNELSKNEKSDIRRKSKKGELKKELKTSLEKSNKEMDKKLLEVASSLNKNEKIKQRRQTSIVSDTDNENLKKLKSNSDSKLDIDLPKKPSKSRRKKTSRRRIDGDILTDIDFE